MANLGNHFSIDVSKGKARSNCVFQGKNYRITVLSEVLVRLEYNEKGIFNDYPTIFAINRLFTKEPFITVKQDDNYLYISSNYFVLDYTKEKPFSASKLVPDSNLKITVRGTDKYWYFNNPEVRNYKGTTVSFDYYKDGVALSKGLYNTDGFASFDDSERPVFVSDGRVMKNPSSGIDLYVFIYNDDFKAALQSYFELTGFPSLVPRYAFGLWWNKDEKYNDASLEELTNNFKRYSIPLSSVLLKNYKAEINGKEIPANFEFDKDRFPNIYETINKLHNNGIYFGLNLKINDGITPKDRVYPIFKKILNIQKDGVIPINVYNTDLLEAFLKSIIDEYTKIGVDYFSIDDINKDKTYSFMLLHYIFTNYMKSENKRGLVFSRNPEIASHRYPVSYSGITNVSWKTLSYLPYFNLTSANIGLSYWSHDIGGYHNGIEDAELYTRYVELGTYSPIFRFSSKSGRYYKREPWKWDVKTKEIVEEYTKLRHRLVPYIYTEAYNYSKEGTPLIRPLYYSYKNIYDEPLYKNEYYFGSELLVCPITESKDSVMNRVLKRIYIPEGTWYEFKTGKKFPGDKRYVTFYKDEDYPVFAKSGAIIPLAVLEMENLNDVKPPKKMEVHVFPGESNSYNLYEDDGISNLYKEGYYIVTNIDYNYRENNYTLIIRPIEGKTGIIPEKRDYLIRFRNTKNAEDVKVNVGQAPVEYTKYIDGNDFCIEVKDVPTNSQLTINCAGKAIEIDAVRLINEDIDGIINDLQIETTLKERIASILFSDKEISKKRIEIRKLKAKGLSTLFIKMFIKLLEYISEI